ncbi:hypothetical protein ACGFNP_08490 [Nonomuraea sp. NPDC049269]|uniref:hypothetical protein n=1 Tax=Nonomuraea sp. NPDC049269 TaxID=3364349 RepID=UPI003719853C
MTPHDRTAANTSHDWQASLEQAFGVLLSRPLPSFDPAGAYAAYYGGNWLYETDARTDAAWLDPAALTGETTLVMEHLLLNGEMDYAPLRFDAKESWFGVDPQGLPEDFARDVDAMSLPSSDLIRGADLGQLLQRHRVDLTAPHLPEDVWCLYQARIASNGTLLDALRVATGIGVGSASLVPYEDKIDAEGEERIAAVADAALRAHLRGFCDPSPIADLSYLGADADNPLEKFECSVVAGCVGAIDQYEITVVQLSDLLSGDRPTAG